MPGRAFRDKADFALMKEKAIAAAKAIRSLQIFGGAGLHSETDMFCIQKGNGGESAPGGTRYF